MNSASLQTLIKSMPQFCVPLHISSMQKLLQYKLSIKYVRMHRYGAATVWFQLIVRFGNMFNNLKFLNVLFGRTLKPVAMI